MSQEEEDEEQVVNKVVEMTQGMVRKANQETGTRQLLKQYISRIACESTMANTNDDVLSQSSSASRRSESFEKGFGSLVKNEEQRKELDLFFAAERHYLVLTNAGKPVFSFTGDIYPLSTMFAMLYAIISKAQTFQFTNDIVLQ